MSEYIPVFTALIGAGAALLGVAGTLAFQIFLRKEKFKELVYKERFTVYKQLVECAVEIVHLWPILMMEGISHIEDPASRDKLNSELARYPRLLSLAEYIAADQVLQPATHFRQLTVLTVKKDGRREQYGGIVGAQMALTTAVRADLGIDPLAKDIKKTVHDTWLTFIGWFRRR